MTIPYIATCPTCGTKTLLKIQKSDYLPEYSVKVNCGRCRTLIRGAFRSAEYGGSGGLILFNAELEDPFVNSENKVDAQYIAEISGELPTKIPQAFDGVVTEQPTAYIRYVSLVDAEVVLTYKRQLENFFQSYVDWRGKYLTAFLLLQDGSEKYIVDCLAKGEPTESDPLALLQEIAYKYTESIFPCPSKFFHELICEELDMLDKTQLSSFILALKKQYDLHAVYAKLISVFVNFMKLYPQLLPAEAMLNCDNKVLNNDTGISTCSFSDIKGFYQDSYETILSLMEIPVGLDNIIFRGHWNKFVPNVIREDKEKNKVYIVRHIYDYRKLTNGKRLQFIDNEETFQGYVIPPADRLLRNGIGHNNIRYDGATQKIHVLNKNSALEEDTKVIPLMEMAMDCVLFSKTAVLFADIVLYLIHVDEN